jgi:putative ABC transport system permease protein
VQFSRNAALSCQILAAHPLRTLLSIAGVVAGIAAVILMVAFGQAAERRILDRIGRMGTNLITVNAAPARLMIGRQRTVGTVTTLTTEDARALAEDCPHVAAAVPAVSRSLVVHGEGRNTTTTVIGMGADGFRVRSVPLASGRPFDADDDRLRTRVAVIGQTVRRNIFGSADPVGQDIRIGRVLFEVVGTARLRGTDATGMDQDDVVFVPLQTAMRRLLNVPYIQTIYVQADGRAWMDLVEREVRDVLRERQRLAEDRPDTFTIQNQQTLIRTERDTARAMTRLIGGVAGIALLVGGVGIMAVMLMAVRERTREIGLRRALGARPRDIRVQFLVEAALLAGSGGVLGVTAGAAGTMAAAFLGGWDAGVSWPAAGGALACSVAVGMVAGIVPALRASRLEPIQALRSD